jgi:DNA adenine methylase
MMAETKKDLPVLTNGRGPYSRYGGSAKYSGLIASLAPDHTKYVEPFAGAASVFFTKDKASKSVLADLDDELVNALRQIKSGGKELIRALKGRERMVTTERFKKLVRSKPKGAIDRLHRFLFIQGAGYSAKHCGPPPEAKKGKPAYNPEKLLPFMEKLKGVSIEKAPFEQTLSKHDGKDTFFFIDPPYPKEWKNTADDIDRERGEAFLDVPKFVKAVRALKGSWIVALGDNKENIDAIKALGGIIFYKRGTETTNTGGTKEAKRYFAANFDVKTAVRQKAIMDSGGFSKLVITKALMHPAKDESRHDFMVRFMDDPKSAEEFPEARQRYAIGIQIWERTKKAIEKRLALWGSTAGKSRVAKRVIPMIPEHKTYVEPFAGGAAVFYAKPKEMSKNEVLSDTHPEVAFSFKYVRDGSDKDFDGVRRKNWIVSKEQARKVHDLKPSRGDDRFYRFAYKRYAMFFRNENRITAIDPSKAGKKPTLINNLEKTRERLKGVKIHNESYEKMFKAYDEKDTFFYLDPPYPRIAQEVGEDQFDEPAFIKRLENLKGKFLLHYDYRDKSKFLNKGWNVKVISVAKTGGYTTGTLAGKLLEVTNYVPAKKAMSYADSENEKYPIDTYEHVRAAISYFSMPKNAGKYSEQEQAKIWGKIKAAAKKLGITLSPDSGPPGLQEKDISNSLDNNWLIPVIKTDEDEKIVTGIVLEPDEVDAQGDTVSKEAIKEAAYRFLAKFNKDTELGFMHKAFGDLGMSLIESWVARGDSEFGGNPVKSGSWLMSVKVDANDKLWEKIKTGEIAGFSIGGVARVSR